AGVKSFWVLESQIRHTNLRGAWAGGAYRARYIRAWPSYGPTGHESIAQASAWVYIFNDPALTRRYLVAHWLENTRSAGLEVLKGRQKSTRALNVSPDPEQIHGFNPGSPDNNN
ncbi:MAG: hypothetical protein QOH78_2017, partial [Verrucomicrobiota bacterium]